MDGDPPDLPADQFSEAARDFVRGCLNKTPRLRPTYAMLLRHAWLAPLMKPPTISEDEEGEDTAHTATAGGVETAARGAGPDFFPDTADKEVADWVKAALEQKRQGKMIANKKPALHEAPLDAMPGSPLLNRADALSRANHEPSSPTEVKPNPGVRMDSPELASAKVHSLDFAT